MTTIATTTVQSATQHPSTVPCATSASPLLHIQPPPITAYTSLSCTLQTVSQPDNAWLELTELLARLSTQPQLLQQVLEGEHWPSMLRAALAVPSCSPAAKQAELDQHMVLLLGSVAGTLCGKQEWQQCMAGELGSQGSMLQRHVLSMGGLRW